MRRTELNSFTGAHQEFNIRPRKSSTPVIFAHAAHTCDAQHLCPAAHCRQWRRFKSRQMFMCSLTHTRPMRQRSINLTGSLPHKTRTRESERTKQGGMETADTNDVASSLNSPQNLSPIGLGRQRTGGKYRISNLFHKNDQNSWPLSLATFREDATSHDVCVFTLPPLKNYFVASFKLQLVLPFCP